MKLLITIVALIHLSAASQLKSIQPKIVNGTDAKIEEFPYLVALMYNTSLRCAGTLLNEYWVLSAAHCLGGNPELMTIEYATTVISNGFNGTREKAVERVIVHERYSSSQIRDDVGLLKLQEPLDTGLQGTYVKLAMPGSYYRTGTLTTVVRDSEWIGFRLISLKSQAGWGTIGSGLPISTVLQKVDLQIYSYEDCRDAHAVSGVNLNIYRTNICAGVPEMGKSECNGDSGKLQWSIGI